MTAQPELLPIPPGPAVGPPSATAGYLLGLLRRHYLPDEARPAGIFAPEIQAPGPTLRKADLVWLGCTAAAGSQLVGHEIKVSRADVLAELADLTKSDPWQRYCDRWWLVIPHTSLITGLELPDSWGVLTPPGGRRTRSMTVYRPAPQLTPAEQAPALRTLAAWLHWKLRDTRNRVDALDKQCTRLDHANHQLRLESPTAHPSPERDVIARIVRDLGGQWNGDQIGTWAQHVEVDDVVAALTELGAIYRRRDDAKRALDDYRRGLKADYDRIGRLLGEISEPQS